MPTTVEVEARLRRTAAACEPLVEALLRDDEPAATGAPPRRPSRRTVGLAAAAAVVVALAIGALVVAGDGEPGGEVRTSAPDTVTLVPPATDPAAGRPLLTTPVDLPDGSQVILGIPGPEPWRQVDALALLQLGGDEVEVRFVPDGSAMATWTVDEQLSERASLVTWGDDRLLAVAEAGWTALVPTSGLADASVTALAQDLTFTPDEGAPVEVGGPGIVVAEVGATVHQDEGDPGFQPRMAPALEVWRATDGAHPLCPYTSPLSNQARCLLDGRLRVEAGYDARIILPGVEADLADGPPAGATSPASLGLSLLDGTEVMLGLPEDRDWDAVAGSAQLVVEDIAEEYTVDVGSGTIDEWVAENGATTEPTLQAGAVVATVGDDATLLASRSGVLLATVVVQQDGVSLFPPSVRETLAAALVTSDSDGPKPILAPGITVVSATTDLLAHQPEEDVVLTATVGAAATAICADPDPGVRCLEGGTVALEPATPADAELVDALEVTVTPPR